MPTFIMLTRVPPQELHQPAGFGAGAQLWPRADGSLAGAAMERVQEDGARVARALTRQQPLLAQS